MTSRLIRLSLSLCAFSVVDIGTCRSDETVPASVRTFLESHCFDCHTGSEAEGGLDLETLSSRHAESDYGRWVRVFDRVHSGEMPPPDSSELRANERQPFLQSSKRWLTHWQVNARENTGRVRARRLTNVQLERTLQDLLGIDIPLASELPDEPRTHGFTTVASGQPMSHFELQRHLGIVDLALQEAFRRALAPEDTFQRKFTAWQVARRNARRRTREPEMLDGKAVTWSSRLIFYGRLPATTARQPGWYRFRIRASALKSPEGRGVWCTIRTGPCVSSAPLLGWVGSFEATEEPREITCECWLPRGHMLEVRPGDQTLKMARFRGGQVGVGEGGPQNVPGVAIHSLTMERIHKGPSSEEIRQRLLGNLAVQRERGRFVARSEDAKGATTKLMHDFARRAFRRPIDESELKPYIDLVHAALDRDEPLLESLRDGYRSLLCSPRFLYFHETPGRLDAWSLASRLSYFLWNTMPDATLLELAAAGKLRQPAVLREQTERMLADERGQRFVRDFAEQWLDLSEIDFTEPDRKLFPSFDVIVQQSMLNETHSFLQTLLDENLGVDHLIDSDFTFLNSRLARFYQIGDVDGDELRRVALDADTRRGGLLTQGAILKVTANGTTTSPVIRGVWISERLLGHEIPPPPENVPAIEPDIRGARTIREQLAKHRSSDSCAACHVKIDPAGFALENYDPAGQWRERYTLLDRNRRRKGPTVDASYDLPDGRSFDDIDGFRELVLTDRPALARNVADKLLTYGTGAPIGFADRPILDDIVEETTATNFGLRSLILAVVTSEVFRTK